MDQSVILADEIMALARYEAELRGRSVSEQITHWLRIGRAIERSLSSEYASRNAAREDGFGSIPIERSEEVAWLDAFTKKMGDPSKEEKSFFAQRRALGRGVGLDADCNLIYADGPIT